MDIKHLVKQHGRVELVAHAIDPKSRRPIAIVMCLRHPEKGNQVLRLDRAKRGGGAACCGRKINAELSDLAFAKTRIDPSIFDGEKCELKVLESDHDRSMIRLQVKGRIDGASIAISGVLKNLKAMIENIKRRVRQIRARHGDEAVIRVKDGKRLPAYCMVCPITGTEHTGLTRISDLGSRRDPRVLERLKAKTSEPVIPLFERQASGPHRLVRQIILELTGLGPEEESTWPGLFGESKKALRTDLNYSGLGRTGIVVEVQSGLHEDPIALFGGEEGLKRRQQNDQIKRDYFLKGKGRPQLIPIRGDAPRKEVRMQVERALASIGFGHVPQ